MSGGFPRGSPDFDSRNYLQRDVKLNRKSYPLVSSCILYMNVHKFTSVSSFSTVFTDSVYEVNIKSLLVCLLVPCILYMNTDLPLLYIITIFTIFAVLLLYCSYKRCIMFYTE